MSKYDPLEAAKLSDEKPKKKGRWGGKKKKDEETNPETPAAKAEVAPAPPKPEPSLEAPPQPSPHKKYRVTNRGAIKFSWNGQMVSFREGRLISSQHYGGEAGIAKLKDVGVELSEVAG